MKRTIGFALVLMAVGTASACTGFYVGKRVSASGETLIGRTVDTPPWNACFREVKVPRGDGVKYAYVCTPSVTSMKFGFFASGCANEKGVILSGTVTGATSERALEADPFVKGGHGEADFPALVIGNAASAAEAIELFAREIATVGHKSPEIYMFADRKEAWLLEVYTGHQWAAVRMPEDKVACFGNDFMIRSFDPSSPDCRHSPDLIALAERGGFLVRGDDGLPDLFRTYSPGLRNYSNFRAWFGHRTLSPSTAGEYAEDRAMPLFFAPEKKVAVEDLFELMRSRYEGTAKCPEEGGGQKVRTIGTTKQATSHVLTLAEDLPDSFAGTVWASLANAEHSVFLPLGAAVSEMDDAYSRDNAGPVFDYDPTLAGNAFRRLCTLSELNRRYYGTGVREFWRARERELLSSYPKALRAAAAKGEAAALTAFVKREQARALADARRIFDELMWYACANNRIEGDGSGATAVPPEIFRPKSEHGLFPFVMDAVPADGVADVSALLPAPAGKDGFVRRAGAHFETDAGRIRFNGMNLTGAANFPKREQAVRLAEGLARRGVNCVRLHYMDADYGNFMQPKERGFCEPDGTLRPDLLDRLDFLVSEFKRRGIYVDLNLQVMRLGKKKGATMFDAGLIADQKAFAKRMLEHVNPYTKLAWKDDPVVAFVELSNEDGVMPLYARDVHRKQEEFARHCIDLEKGYLREMRRYLREELGVKVPISSSCIPFLSPYALTDGDFIDYHDYWCHPDPINDQWTCMDEPLVKVTGTDWFAPALAAGRRPAGYPFTISEYGHPYPSTYGAEGQPMMRALGAFQDWDAVFTYSWANRENVEPNYVEYFFSASARPDILAHMPAAAAMFLRGDVRACRSWIDVPLSEKDYVDGYYTKNRSWCKSADVQQTSGAKVRFEHGLVHGLRLDLTGKAPMPSEQPRPGLRIVSDTEEIVWDRTAEDGGYGIVDTPNVKFFTGFPKGRAFDLHGVRLEVGKTQLGWATVSLLSHGANGFGENGAARILLAATGLCRNTGAKLSVDKVGADGMRQIATRGADWGTGPVLCEGIPLKVTFSQAAKVRCWALDPSGRRRAELTVAGNQVVTAADDETVWYEIDVLGK